MPSTDNRCWLLDIIFALRDLGGVGWLQDIYHRISLNRPNLPPNWESVIRATIQAHSSDAKQFDTRNPDVFYHAEGRGRWGLRQPEKSIAGRSREALMVQALAEITREEFESCHGHEQELSCLLEDKIVEIKRRFKMPGA